MQQIFLFALLGLGSGALIAAIALGIVLSYRGSGTINIATGAIAMLGAYVFYALHVKGQLNVAPLPKIHLGAPVATWIALPITLIICALVGVLVEYVIVRPLRTATPLAKLVASLGLMLFIQSVIILRFGYYPLAAPSLLPHSTVTIFSTPAPVDRFILAGIVLAFTLILSVVYRFTRFGLATRAASENETAALLAGLSPSRVSLVNTVAAYVVIGAMGVLVAPLLQLDPNGFPLTVVPALAAALLARFTSFGIAAGVGLLIGAGESILYYVTTQSWFPMSGGQPLPGVQELIILLIIVVTMFVRGDVLPRRGFLVEKRLPAVPWPERRMRPAVIGVVAGAIAMVVLPFAFRQALINSVLAIPLALSIIVITGFVGQISLAQLTLGGVSGFILSKLAVHLGIGFPLGPLIAVIATTGFGLLMAVPALRIRGVSLAVVTLAAAVAIENFGFDNSTWGGGDTGSPVPNPHLLGINLGNSASFPGWNGQLPSPVLGFMAIAISVALCLLVSNLRRSTYGQRMLAVRSNESAAAAVGIDVRRVKLVAFGLSSAIAGVAGVLYAYNFGTIDGSRFDTITGIGFVALVYLGGITTVSGSVLAAVLATQGVMTVATNKWLGVPTEYTTLLGAVGVLFTVVKNPEGVAGAMAIDRKRRRQARLEKKRRRAGGIDLGSPDIDAAHAGAK